MSVVLGFDTATRATAAAVTRPGAAPVEARHDPPPGERPGHAPRLLGLIEAALAQADQGWDEVDRLAVGVGPGTFTGLRIGIATARALAQARGLPLAGVSSLRALAAGAAAGESTDRTLLAVLDARRREAFVAAWAGDRELVAPAAVAVDGLGALVARLAEGGGTPLAAGEGAVEFRPALESAGAAVPADDSARHRLQATEVCRLGARATDTRPQDVRPAYLRLADAEIAYRQRRSTPAPDAPTP